MKWLNRLFMKTRQAPMDLMITSPQDKDWQNILGRLDHLCIDLFKEHHRFMSLAKTSAIIESVWGYRKHGALTEQQHQINRRIEPVVAEICIELESPVSSWDNGFTLRSILYNFIIFKLLYMVERHRKSDSGWPKLSMN